MTDSLPLRSRRASRTRSGFSIPCCRKSSAKRAGINFANYTPDLPHRALRDEILKWLKMHRYVRRYAALDDEDDELDELPLFQPDPRHGLEAKVARQLIRYLNGDTDRDLRRRFAVRVLENARAVLRQHIG
jgi:hypothetical protein